MITVGLVLVGGSLCHCVGVFFATNFFDVDRKSATGAVLLQNSGSVGSGHTDAGDTGTTVEDASNALVIDYGQDPRFGQARFCQFWKSVHFTTDLHQCHMRIEKLFDRAA